MDFGTTYLGLELSNPLVAGASPLSDDVDACKRLEDAGTSAVVMHSLFMEQIAREQQAIAALDDHSHSSAEASSYFAEPVDFSLGPEEYLEQVAKLKQALKVPVIGSLNGTSVGRWTRYAKLIEQAGADALELNVYYLPLDGEEGPLEVEERYISILQSVREHVGIPVAMKLPYFFTAPVHLAKRLEAAGADGLVLFNRLYQPELDVEELSVRPVRPLSHSGSLKQRILWIAAMFGRVDCSLALTGGVHTPLDAIKAMMAGANVAQMTSALLMHGPEYTATMLHGIRAWMEENEYDSVRQMQGSMSLLRSPDPEAFERANYMRSLQTWNMPQNF